MKTMTCKQLGGPCDAQLQGNTADEIMQAGQEHLEEMTKMGDVAHQQAKKMMDDVAKNPDMGKDWFAKLTADFAAQPEDE
jgi:hypothetical protein